MNAALAIACLVLMSCGGPEASPVAETRLGERAPRARLGPRELPPLAGASAKAPGGRRLAVATKTREVCVVDLDRGEVVLRAPTGASDATSIGWTRDDALLSTLGADGEVRVIDSESGQLSASFRSRPGRCGWPSVRQHAFVADDTRIVVAIGCVAGELWEWAEPRLVAGFDTDSEARSFAASRSGRFVAIADALGRVGGWDTRTGRSLGWCLNVAVATRQPGIVALEFSPDDAQLAIGCGDGVVRLVSLGGQGDVRELGTPTWPFLPDSVGSARFAPDGSRLVATLFPAHDQRLFDVASGEMISSLDRGGGNDAPIDAWFSPDGDRIVCSNAREVRDGRDLTRLLSSDIHYGAGGYRSDGVHAWAATGGMLRVFRVLDGATVLELSIVGG